MHPEVAGGQALIMAKIAVIASYGESLLNFRGPLLRAMVDLGHEVVGVAPDPAPGLRERLADVGVRFRPYPLRRATISARADLIAFRALRDLLRDEAPDVVFSYTIKPVIYGGLAARAAGVPDIVALITGLGSTFQAPGLKGWVVNRVVVELYRRALARTRLVFFQNPDDRALFLELGLVRPAQSLVVRGSGVDLDHYRPQPLPDPPPRFLLISRLIEDKGIREYVDAARIVRTRHPGTVFRLVGPRDEHARAIPEADLDAWVAEGVVDYAGPVHDVRPELAACGVYVLPSYREGMPRTVLEAMAVGRPVITTDAPGCRDTVVMNENGYLVPPRNAEALAMAMLRFVEDPALARRMGARAREIAKERFDVNKVNAVILDALGLTGGEVA